MKSPDTFIAGTTRWGHGYDKALEAAIDGFTERFADRKPSVILLHPDAPEIEVPEGMKMIRKRTVPLGEVWVG